MLLSSLSFALLFCSEYQALQPGDAPVGRKRKAKAKATPKAKAKVEKEKGPIFAGRYCPTNPHSKSAWRWQHASAAFKELPSSVLSIYCPVTCSLLMAHFPFIALRHIAERFGSSDKLQRAFFEYVGQEVDSLESEGEVESCCHHMAFCFVCDMEHGALALHARNAVLNIPCHDALFFKEE